MRAMGSSRVCQPMSRPGERNPAMLRPAMATARRRAAIGLATIRAAARPHPSSEGPKKKLVDCVPVSRLWTAAQGTRPFGYFSTNGYKARAEASKIDIYTRGESFTAYPQAYSAEYPLSITSYPRHTTQRERESQREKERRGRRVEERRDKSLHTSTNLRPDEKLNDFMNQPT